MAMPAQENASAVRNGPVRPPAAVRAPRPDEIPAAFPGLLAVALAQSLPPDLSGQGSGRNTVATTAGWAIAAGPAASMSPLTGQSQASGGVAAAAAPPVPSPAAAFAARAATLSDGPSASATVAVVSTDRGIRATGAATPQADPPAPAGGGGSAMAGSAIVATAGRMTAAGPAAPATSPPGPVQASGDVASAAMSATRTPTAVAPAQPATPAVALPAPLTTPATAAVGSADSDAHSPGQAVPSPAAASPRQGLAEAWQAANLAAAAILAPPGQGAASPPPGSLSPGAAVPDAGGAGGQDAADGAPPVTVSRQVTIQLLKHAGDATAPGSRLTLRLDPPQLGRVEVSFEPQGNRLLVTLTAQTPEAERALRNGAAELQHALAGAGGKWQDVQVKIEPASGRDEAPPEGSDGEDPGEQPSRRRQARDDD